MQVLLSFLLPIYNVYYKFQSTKITEFIVVRQKYIERNCSDYFRLIVFIYGFWRNKENYFNAMKHNLKKIYSIHISIMGISFKVILLIYSFSFLLRNKDPYFFRVIFFSTGTFSYFWNLGINLRIRYSWNLSIF